MPAPECWVYILASHSRVLYVGMTNNVARRLTEHRTAPKGFVARYRLHKLVYVEWADGPLAAIRREKQIKRWSRSKKVALIERNNPGWDDLAANWPGFTAK